MKNHYLDHQYTEKLRLTNLSERTNSRGEVIQATETRLTHYSINLANTQGMKKMKYKTLSKIGSTVIASNLDAQLYFYITENQNGFSMLTKATSSDYATSDYLARRFGVTPQKIRAFMKRCIDEQLIRKIKRSFYIVNPYLIAPYNCKNHNLNQLQLWWDSNPTELLEFEKEISQQESVVDSIRKFGEAVDC